MKQFILPSVPGRNGMIRLTGDDYHYLVRVRRVKSGDVFQALCARQPYMVRVVSISGGVLSGEVSAPEEVNGAGLQPGPVLPPVVLFQALPKGAKTGVIVRQATEGAVSEIVLFVSERSEVRPREGKEERWRRIVKEARQQSGSAADTRVRLCPSLDAALKYWTTLAGGVNTTALLLHEVPRPPLAQETFHHYLGNEPVIVAVAAGPEGGFSPPEVNRFLEAGFKAVWMGNSILRTETAALYGIAAARIILLEKAAWTLKKN